MLTAKISGALLQPLKRLAITLSLTMAIPVMAAAEGLNYLGEFCWSLRPADPEPLEDSLNYLQLGISAMGPHYLAVGMLRGIDDSGVWEDPVHGHVEAAAGGVFLMNLKGSKAFFEYEEIEQYTMYGEIEASLSGKIYALDIRVALEDFGTAIETFNMDLAFVGTGACPTPQTPAL